MTLLSILIGLGVEFFLVSLDRLRNYTWFEKYSDWLEYRCNKYRFWNGAAGVLLTLVIPLSVLYLFIYWLDSIWFVLSFVFSVLVFIYCLGSDFYRLLDDYVEALEAGDLGNINGIEHQLGKDSELEDRDDREIIKLLLLRAHEHIFAVIFWFVILGMVGSLLYILAVRLKDKFKHIHGSYADTVRDFHKVLIWPSARLLAVGFALGGSLVDAIEGWRDVEGHMLDRSEDIVFMSGSGALQYQQQEVNALDEKRDEFSGAIQELQALLNRTLIIWLTILGIMTISEYIS